MSDIRPPSGAAPGASDAPEEHDAWLREALRHAPDATAAPPNALREAILAEARSAVQARREPAPRSSFVAQATAFWSWLARPPIAAGFASVMAATLVGLMWWDRPMDETLAPPPTPAAQSEATAPPPAAAPNPANTIAAPGPVAEPAAPAPTPAPIESRRAMTAKPAPAVAAEDKQRKDEAPSSAMPSPPDVSPFPGAALNRSEAAARNQAAAPALAKKEDAETRPSATPPRPDATEPLAAATPVEGARSADAASIDARGAGATGNMAKVAPAPRQRAATAPRDVAGAFGDRLAAAPAPAAQAFATGPPAREGQVASERRATHDSTLRPMAALLGSLSSSPERWTLPLANGAAAPLSAAMQAWLASVDAATAGRWQAAAARTIPLDAMAADAAALALSHDGRAAAALRIEAGGVFFEQSPGPAWFAPLPADVLARLRASLPPFER